jgi:alkaline phosphatase D
MPFLATWDDHDYGLNDAGADFAHARAAAALFHDFWQLPATQPDGIHYARIIGPAGRRVQIIMLDTRSFRSRLRRKGDGFPHWGRYEPDPDPAKTMLGPAQWAWLEAELGKPADLRLLVSSVQVLAEGHGFERWGNLPAERERLLALIDRAGIGGLVMLSGDRHSGAVYTATTPGGAKLVELTASSLNRSYGPSRDARLPPLVSGPFHVENYGLIDIDWSGRMMALRLKGMGGATLAELAAPFAEAARR